MQCIPDVMVVQAFLSVTVGLSGFHCSVFLVGNIIILLRGISKGVFQAMLLHRGHQNFNSIVNYLVMNQTVRYVQITVESVGMDYGGFLKTRSVFEKCVNPFLLG